MTLVLRWVLLFSFIAVANCWRSDRKPRKYGESIPTALLLPQHNYNIQRKIVLYHNFFRARVSPPAANMLKMSWHTGVADAAQRWAQMCQMLTHDNVTGRYIDEYGSCGQNIFIATQKVPWYFAIKSWNLEKFNFTYGSNYNDMNVVGHYTQMVWAASHEVGCGFAKCYMGSQRRPYFNYICNYCPIGNRPGETGTPYKRGSHCSGCRRHCKGGRLCTNGCPKADLWANCAELQRDWPNWLCDTERGDNCGATCHCDGKIY